MMDELLFESQGYSKNVYWRPGDGRSLATNSPMYHNFQKVVRTVHIIDALHICQQHRMQPKSVFAPSILKQKLLRNNHPCKNIKVLWFGTEPLPGTDEEHDWYGNIQFAMSADELFQRWKYCFLVEVMTARTHTATRLLITNTDYSMVLPEYNPNYPGGPWLTNSNGHFVLADCNRYNNIGFNRNGHTLEFMIEVTEVGQRKILEICEISFRNHLSASNLNRPQRCHRTQYTPMECPTPFSSAVASRVFFDQHQRKLNMATPKLSEKAEYYRQCHYMMSNGPSSISHTLRLPQPLVPLPPSRIPPHVGHLLNGLAPIVNPFLRNSFVQTSAEIFQHAGGGFWVFLNQRIQSNFMGNYTEHQQQILISWWSSLTDYSRGVLTWFWSQECHEGQQHFVPGWQTPAQLQKKKRNKRRKQNKEHLAQPIQYSV